MFKRTRVFLAAAGLVTMAADADAQKGKPSASPCGTGNIPLVVTVYDSPSQLQMGDPFVMAAGEDPLGYTAYQYEANQSPDAAGRSVPLTDGGKGSQKVTAHFEIENCAFDFVLNLSYTSRDLIADLPLVGAPIRSEFLRFDRIASVPITADASITAWCDQGVVNSSLQTSTPRDNYAPCGEDANGNVFVRRAAGGYLYEGPARDYRYRFRRSPLDANYSDCQINALLCTASYVRVYRPDATTWVITPDTAVMDIDNNVLTGWNPATVAIMSFVDNNETSLLGHDTMPFRMVLKLKQP